MRGWSVRLGAHALLQRFCSTYVGATVGRRGYAVLIVVLFDWLVERDGIDLIRL